MPTIFDHFQNLTLTDDQHNALEKITEFLNSDAKIFILKGYAGSGKTTLLKGLVKYLQEEKKQCQVMAPTGRAAKILRKKVGQGATIHKSIYKFDRLENDENTYEYIYPIRLEEDSERRVFIVDEASMISNKESKQEFFQFGTDILLQDLLTFSRVKQSANKIIFVGDPAQLPPVTDETSYALEATFFENEGLKVMQAEMTQVVRQTDNLILKNATKIRNLIELKKKTELAFDYDDTFIKIESKEIAELYTDLFPMPELGQGVVIAFSNGQCLHYNLSIRSKIYPNSPNIVTGDILLINQNCRVQGIDVFNGDMLQVIDVSDYIITHPKIRVFDNKEVCYVDLYFRKVRIKLEETDKELECYIIDSLLNSTARDLTPIEKKALYIDFVIRFREENKGKYKEDRKYKRYFKYVGWTV